MVRTDPELVDIWESQGSWEVSEAKEQATVDGVHVLGRVKGQFFVPDGVSENKRFYPRGLWENVLSRDGTKKRLADRTMFGMLGHEDKPITDDDLRKGLVSHLVTNLWIDSAGAGMGEALVLNTDTGRNLWTYLKAGSKLRSSSRASGKYEGKTPQGVPMVSTGAYIFETFDFVLNPGFPQALPGISEKLENKNNMETPLDLNRLVSTLSESRDALQQQVTALLSEKAVAAAALVASDAKAKALQESAQEGAKVVEAARMSEAAVAEALKDLGITSVREALQVLKAQDREAAKVLAESKLTGSDLKQYIALGAPAAVTTKLSEASVKLEAYSAIGEAKDIEKTIADATQLLEEFKAIGAPKEITEVTEEAARIIETYQEIGTPKEINEALKSAAALIDTFTSDKRAKEMDAQVESLSGKYGVAVDVVRTVLESMTEEKAVKVLQSMAQPGKSFRKAAPAPAPGESISLKEASGAARYFSSISRPMSEARK